MILLTQTNHTFAYCIVEMHPHFITCQFLYLLMNHAVLWPERDKLKTEMLSNTDKNNTLSMSFKHFERKSLQNQIFRSLMVCLMCFSYFHDKVSG